MISFSILYSVSYKFFFIVYFSFKKIKDFPGEIEKMMRTAEILAPQSPAHSENLTDIPPICAFTGGRAQNRPEEIRTPESDNELTTNKNK